MMKPAKDAQLVLVVEDDAATAEALSELLRLRGYRSVVSRNGQEALDRLRSGARPCLILLDIMMPVKNGWDVRDELLSDRELAEIPVVVVTADMTAMARATSLRLPLLTKPVDPANLIATVEHYC
jgi:CheY-like chemotaxis protein